MDRIKSIILSTKDGKEKYDAVLKSLLAEKQILALLLQRFVPEFANISLKDIEKKYIMGVFVTDVEVERNRSNIEPLANEDKTLNEGNVVFDIIFKVKYPSGKRGFIGMFINVEIQNDYKLGYPIEVRAFYYAARRFSSQLQSLSKGTEYKTLEKVYSIWICTGENVPDYEANTVTLYCTEKCDIIGTVNRDDRDYDMMNVIIIRIKDEVPVEDHFLKILQTLCSSIIKGRAKLAKLKELGVEITEDITEGVKNMSGFGEALVKKTAKETQKEMAMSLLEQGAPYEMIATAAHVSVEVVKEWEKKEKAKK